MNETVSAMLPIIPLGVAELWIKLDNHQLAGSGKPPLQKIKSKIAGPGFGVNLCKIAVKNLSNMLSEMYRLFMLNLVCKSTLIYFFYCMLRIVWFSSPLFSANLKRLDCINR